MLTALPLLHVCVFCCPQAAAAQADSVAVLRRLPEFGVSLLPAQLTSLPDKHLLLQRILFGRHTYAAAAAAAASGGSDGSAGSSVAPWRRLGDVLELAALLGLGSEDEQNEVGRWQMTGALDMQHALVSTHLCGNAAELTERLLKACCRSHHPVEILVRAEHASSFYIVILTVAHLVSHIPFH